MLKLVPTKIDKLYPKTKLIDVTWNWFWFRNSKKLIMNKMFPTFYLYTRGINSRTIWLGPIQFDLRASWITIKELS